MSFPNGPYFDELRVGEVFDTAPALTLTEGRAAVHGAIVGTRVRLSLDSLLSRRVAGRELADPALVWDVAIGQSTRATRRVVANVFYRGLAFHRLPSIGDTLATRTEVVGLRQNASRPTGLAALRITTRDQENRLVLDFWRCAMLPLSDSSLVTGRDDDFTAVGELPDISSIVGEVSGWDLDALPDPVNAPTVGDTWDFTSGDVVSSAAELARLTLNLAHVHHDRYSQPTGRLVYGGHTIGIALAHLSRAMPEVITVAGWRSCDHTGPVREGDTLRSRIEIEGGLPSEGSVRPIDVRVHVTARRDGTTSPSAPCSIGDLPSSLDDPARHSIEVHTALRLRSSPA